MRHTYKKLKTLLKYCELKSASSHSLPQPFSVPLTPSRLLSPFFQFFSPLPKFPLYFFSIPLTPSQFSFYPLPFPNSLQPFPIPLYPSFSKPFSHPISCHHVQIMFSLHCFCHYVFLHYVVEGLLFTALFVIFCVLLCNLF